MNKYDVVIGIEVHAELKTNSKIYSDAATLYGKQPNSQTTVVDLGYPGSLPTLNYNVIKKALMAAIICNCKINKVIHFDRKNYFYPDTPKNYQITQDKTPIGYDGYVEIEINNKIKKIRIERIHIEEDTGKSIHSERGTLLNYNRAGNPLIEIVTKPDISSSEEARAYLEKLRQMLLFTHISDVKMEEGSMRCDANISLKPQGSDILGTKVELKNLNSINNVKHGIDYEVMRQRQVLDNNQVIIEATRRYNETTGETVLMRRKETGNDYRYFPEPDIPIVEITETMIKETRENVPMLSEQRLAMYNNDLNIPSKTAELLVQDVELSDFYNAIIKEKVNYKLAANYLVGDVKSYLNDKNISLSATKLSTQNYIDLINKLDTNEISSKIAKQLINIIMTEDISLNDIIAREGLVQISNADELQTIINNVINSNEQSVIDYHNGKDRAIKYLMGQVMKATKGKANPQIVNELLIAELNRRKK